MACRDTLRSTWSVRHHARVGMADRVFENLTSNCRAICVEHFPSSSGFALRITRLSGPIEGRTFTVVRGSFQGTVSLQRYPSPGTSGHQEIRLVAMVHEVLPPPDKTPHRWAIWGPAMGSTGLITFGAASAASVSATTIAMFFIPLLVSLRLAAMMWLASEFHRKAKREAAALLPPNASTAGGAMMLSSIESTRWQSALRELADQQNYVRMRISEQPFRTMAPVSALSAEVA